MTDLKDDFINFNELIMIREIIKYLISMEESLDIFTVSESGYYFYTQTHIHSNIQQPDDHHISVLSHVQTTQFRVHYLCIE